MPRRNRHSENICSNLYVFYSGGFKIRFNVTREYMTLIYMYFIQEDLKLDLSLNIKYWNLIWWKL